MQGKPNVYPRYGDIAGSWAQRNRDGNQFIEVIVVDSEIECHLFFLEMLSFEHLLISMKRNL